MGAYPSAIADLVVEKEGRIKDLVSGSYATINRSGSKWAWDSDLQQLKEFGSNLLGAQKYPSGVGYWAAIEDARTNYLLNSSFEIDSNADGVSDNWTAIGVGLGTAIRSRPSDCVIGTVSQRVMYAAVSGDVGQRFGFYQDTAVGSFSAGDVATLSLYAKGSVTGSTVIEFRIEPLNASSGTLGGVAAVASPALTSSWKRFTVSSAALPSGTSRVRVMLRIAGVDNGDSIDMYIDAAQLEKGDGATTYIPTESAPVTRPADVVNVPTLSLHGEPLTIGAVVNTPASTSPSCIFHWYKDSTSSLSLNMQAGNAYASVTSDGIAYSAGKALGAMPDSVIGRFQASGNDVLVGGVNGTATSSHTAVAGTYTNQRIGAYSTGGGYLNTQLHRLVFLPSAISDSEAASLHSTLVAGATSAASVTITAPPLTITASLVGATAHAGANAHASSLSLTALASPPRVSIGAVAIAEALYLLASTASPTASGGAGAKLRRLSVVVNTKPPAVNASASTTASRLTLTSSAHSPKVGICQTVRPSRLTVQFSSGSPSVTAGASASPAPASLTFMALKPKHAGDSRVRWEHNDSSVAAWLAEQDVTAIWQLPDTTKLMWNV